MIVDVVKIDAPMTYLKRTEVVPVESHYEEIGEKPYIKYNCPVCLLAGNRHQINKGTNSCPICGVFLHWGDSKESISKHSYEVLSNEN